MDDIKYIKIKFPVTAEAYPVFAVRDMFVIPASPEELELGRQAFGELERQWRALAGPLVLLPEPLTIIAALFDRGIPIQRPAKERLQ